MQQFEAVYGFKSTQLLKESGKGNEKTLLLHVAISERSSWDVPTKPTQNK